MEQGQGGAWYERGVFLGGGGMGGTGEEANFRFRIDASALRGV